jgi:ribosome-associated toxin RatA of RatAB toxin-antitoxin module
MDGCVGAEVLARTEDRGRGAPASGEGRHPPEFSRRATSSSRGASDMDSLEGPFDSFEGLWGFEALRDDACKVSLYLAFRMRNVLAGRAARKLFDSMANTLVDALCRRARQVYGER